MSAFEKLRRVFIGQSNQADSVSQDDLLKSVDVPVIDADCRFCPDPCDQDHDDFAKMSIDMESDLLGSVKPYRRQVVISTGKSDWHREVTEADGTLAAFLCSANERHCTSSDSTGKASSAPNDNKPLPPGLFTQDTSNRLSILNGSHHSLSLHHDPASTLETVIILPDYKVVTDVPRSLEGAETLWKSALDPAYGRSGAPERSDTLKSWVLPYSCLILLCSHKRRDKRCAIAAPVLEKTFTQYLEREGWEVHTDLEDLSGKPTLEPLLSAGNADAETVYQSQLAALPGQHRALILRNSHIGGHKFAGNVIIYTPTGASVWYGRVTSHHVESIVANTIIDGRVLSPILRGGLNIARPGCRTVYDW
ncbi:Sucrase/ferredoxin-like-domain-containing protein [Pisolithus sp. B1]|nr:Sucrase/ferredoxin-like-domain-containing protein [Pisolithus sp. B1]KAI6117640.1 Sucrase/ferredoxin-like-domain-containing protein [Pisolithus croceorrhizus]